MILLFFLGHIVAYWQTESPRYVLILLILNNFYYLYIILCYKTKKVSVDEDMDVIENDMRLAGSVNEKDVGDKVEVEDQSEKIENRLVEKVKKNNKFRNNIINPNYNNEFYLNKILNISTYFKIKKIDFVEKQ